MTVAFIFPGQGSQYVGMGRVNNSAVADKFFAAADAVLGFSLKAICLNGPEAELKKTAITQPAIFTVSAIILELLKAKGIEPAIAAGHSLGEYGALYAAGAISFPDAVKILNLRGRFMQEAVPLGEGKMSAVLGLAPDIIQAICAAHQVAAANFNAPDQTVISGTAEAVDKVSMILKEKGAKRVIPLPVSAPFHSPLMRPAQERLAVELEKINIADAKIPVVANVTAAAVTDGKTIKKLLVEQVTAPVRWVESIQYITRSGISQFIEVGPGKVLAGLIKKIDPTVGILSGEEETK